MSKASQGWLPKQHGAWAMLVVPYVVGLIMAGRVRPLTLGDAALGLTWLTGYFAFSALSLWLKASAAKKVRYRVALVTYSCVAAVFGALTLYLDGLRLLWWTPVYAPLLGGALWLVAHKKERALASGVLTILASCGLMAVLRFGTPQGVVTTFSQQTLSDLAAIVAVTGYFIGTVYHVKALIRERNDPDSATRNAIYHVALASVVTGAVVAGWLSWGWAVWSVWLFVRAVGVPRIATQHKLTPMQIGLIEIVNSALIVLLAALA